MLAGWIVATIACTATMIGTANVTVILLRRTGLSKGVRKLLAMGIGQVATAAVGSYFLVSSGFGRLFTLHPGRNLALVWVTATVAASLTVVISNRVSGELTYPLSRCSVSFTMPAGRALSSYCLRWLQYVRRYSSGVWVRSGWLL